MVSTLLRRFSLPAALTLALVLIAQPSRGDDPPQAAGKVTPAEALQKLKEGNTRFAADKSAAKNDSGRRVQTAAGQKPFAIILACSDSRVAPELVFDQSIGDLFVVRVAGNVTDPNVLGSIEYAVLHLGSPLIVVVGHEKCGAVAAVVDGAKEEGNIATLLKEIHVGDKSGGLAGSVKANAEFHAAAMLKHSKVIADMVKGERVQIVTGYYDLTSGRVEWLGVPGVKKGK